MRVLVFGDLNLDIFFRLDIDVIELEDISYISNIGIACPGGCAGNIGVALKKLGIEPIIVSTVGKDVFGKLLLDNLIDEKIAVKTIKTVDRDMTGIMVIILRRDGKRTIIGYRGANVYNVVNENDVENLTKAIDYIYISGFARHNLDNGKSIEILIKSSISNKIPIGIDLGGIDRHFLFENLSKYKGFYTDIFLNIDELKHFFELPIEDALKNLYYLLKPSTIFLKMGGEGSIVYHDNVKEHLRAIPIKNVKDTTGCGDAYNAGTILGFYTEVSPRERGILGNLMGAYKACGFGTKYLPKSLEELEIFANKYLGDVRLRIRKSF